jgi:hypothetical protein
MNFTREEVLEFVKNNFFYENKKLKRKTSRRKIFKYFKVIDFIKQQTSFLVNASEEEHLFCFLNNITEIKICKFCEKEKINFGDFVYGYQKTCPKTECRKKAVSFNFIEENGLTRHQNITARMMIPDENGISQKQKIALKAANTMKNTVLSTGLTIYETTTKKMINTKLNDIDELGRNSFTRGAFKTAEVMRTTISDNGKTIQQNAIEKSKNVMINKIDEFGYNGYEQNAFKAVKTKKNTICNNGKSVFENQNEKISVSKYKVLENGLTVAQNAAKKGVEIMRNTIHEDGQNTLTKIAYKAAETKRNTIYENGQNGLTKAAYKAAATISNTFDSEGKTLYDRNRERLSKMTENGMSYLEYWQKNGWSKIEYYKDYNIFSQGGLEKKFLNNMERFDYIKLIRRAKTLHFISPKDNKEHDYFPDFEYKEYIFEIKSTWTYDRSGRDTELRIFNNSKFKYTLMQNKKLILIFDNKKICIPKLEILQQNISFNYYFKNIPECIDISKSFFDNIFL